MADRHVVGMQVFFANGADHYFPGVHPDAHQQRRTALLAELVTIPPHLVLHAQGSIERPLGMVFMRDGGAEQGKDAIPKSLRHIALIAMHCIHHDVQSRIDNGAGFFRI